MALNVPFSGPAIDFSSLANMGQSIGGTLGRRNLSRELQTAIEAGDYNKAYSVLAGRGYGLEALKLKAAQDQTQALNNLKVLSAMPEGMRARQFYNNQQSAPTQAPPMDEMRMSEAMPSPYAGKTKEELEYAAPAGTAEKVIKSAEAEGKELGEALASYQRMTAKLPGLYETVKQLNELGRTSTYTKTGQAYDTARKELGLEPRQSAIDRTTYISMVDNQILPLLRDTFGAQFTEREGQTLKATLGNPDYTPEEKTAVLNAFIAQKVRDVEALARQTGQQSPPRPETLETPQEPQVPSPGASEAGVYGFGGSAQYHVDMARRALEQNKPMDQVMKRLREYKVPDYVIKSFFDNWRKKRGL